MKTETSTETEKTDLLLYNPVTGKWVVRTSSAGWFALNQTGVSAGAGWDLRVAYLDGDAKADVLWYKPSTGATRVWITQTPTAYTVISRPEHPARGSPSCRNRKSGGPRDVLGARP